MSEHNRGKRLSRREFMKAGVAVAGAASLLPGLPGLAAAQAPRPKAVPRNRTLILTWIGSREGRWVDFDLWNP
jgi:anaerobic selenocysteine-containing dehydrogenase